MDLQLVGTQVIFGSGTAGTFGIDKPLEMGKQGRTVVQQRYIDWRYDDTLGRKLAAVLGAEDRIKYAGAEGRDN